MVLGQLERAVPDLEKRAGRRRVQLLAMRLLLRSRGVVEDRLGRLSLRWWVLHEQTASLHETAAKVFGLKDLVRVVLKPHALEGEGLRDLGLLGRGHGGA